MGLFGMALLGMATLAVAQVGDPDPADEPFWII
jgi:hypothetical protein